MAIIDAWIEPGTTVISDCWGAYRNLDKRNYTDRTVIHSKEFVNHENGAHTNTIERTGSGRKNSPVWKANKFKTKEDTENVFLFLESIQNTVLHQCVLNKTSLKWRP